MHFKGFLSTEDDVVPGNNGIKDQIVAFQFIQKYIQYFGGNPNSVTIAGNSAGGGSVHLHYMINKSKGKCAFLLFLVIQRLKLTPIYFITSFCITLFVKLFELIQINFLTIHFQCNHVCFLISSI